ncbi:uroporphyrinogen-III C-methyltransferase [Bacillus alveayuensis]|uniref:uroporphyrinogen-III C-methyltransferase n=1 Tax=Aeribacillus alveayuensis TaxID=279215 RepID=A0ABT9VL31_9BACI|nr:uroporphyrinogen-III C-methyltransferase [Bacillus alveayuensis]MDQ0161677.1 uroporphyrin-III C-methyltransferase [Bacillus alveayuensis]
MGKVFIVGAGPGDPELITLKAIKCIQQADVIMYDRLINKELLQYAKKDADLLYCGKLPNYHTMKQETINKFLVKFAKAGKVVTRLKGGDPFLFGRGGEEVEYLVRHQIPFEIVPGITAAMAASSYAGIPLTFRNVSASCAFITGHRAEDNKSQSEEIHLMKSVDTLAIYMGVSNLPTIQKKLQLAGCDIQTPVAFIEWASTNKQRTIISTIKEMVNDAAKHQVKNPCLMIVGEVVKFHQSFNWFENEPENLSLNAGVTI